jgi:FAD/FMN-containing dehydrogenase
MIMGGALMLRRQFLRSTSAFALSAAALPRAVFAQAGPGALADLQAVRGDRSPVTIPGAVLTDLKNSLRGSLLLPQDAGYDQARRVLNASIDRRPALVIQPSGAADVSLAVSFARSFGLLVAVKCGGHSFSGQSTCDGGLQIDLSPMRGVQVDVQRRRAWVEGGTLLGAVDHEAMAQGLVTPLGTVSHTGAGGLTTGGGFGRKSRIHGLALDNVTAFDIVTADGKLRRASPKDNPDLYWAVRGGGGNFGIVTAFEFQLHPAERKVISGSRVFPVDRARDVLRAYADFLPTAPDELYIDWWTFYPPGGPGVCGFDVCYSGPPQGAERVLAPLSKLGTPLKDTVKSVDYVAAQRSTDQTDARNRGDYTKNGFVTGIDERVIDALLTGLQGGAKRTTVAYFQHCGGAIGRVKSDATAFPHRFALANMMVMTQWDVADGSAEPIEWSRTYWKSLEAFTRGFYVNEVEGNEGARVLNANYLGNYPRLARIKQQYDPTNLFRLNANITPAA